MGAVYLRGWLLRTSRKKDIVSEKEEFQRKGFTLGNIKMQSS